MSIFIVPFTHSPKEPYFPKHIMPNALYRREFLMGHFTLIIKITSG